MASTQFCAKTIRRLAGFTPVLLAMLLLPLPAAADLETGETDLGSLSIEDLMELEVTSVSKHAQPLSEAAAAVYVLTGEEIRRSGMTTIPEALRMVPGLAVARIDASRWSVTARGFSSQFANKLLVLIDGRSVYTPLFSGVFWDVQDVMMEDIDRIEVVRGPGGTLWGANAVNGVINIITKRADETQGLLTSAGMGSQEEGFGSVRYGMAVGEDIHIRSYVKYFKRDDFDSSSGGSANDRWDMVRGGFRMDWDVTPDDLVTFQGDYYDGETHSTLLSGAPDSDDLSGGNILTRWSHSFSEVSDMSAQLYFDRTERKLSLIEDTLNTLDLEFQHRFQMSAIHDVVWGAGYRLSVDEIENTAAVGFSPEDRTDNLASAFVQNEFRFLEDSLHLILGSKFEYNEYTDFEFQPNLRVLWQPDTSQSVWGAVSRAVRTPSRADDGVSFFSTSPVPGVFNTFSGNDDFESEDLLAFEIGYRAQPVERFSIDATAYFNLYDDLRSTEILGPPAPLPSPPFPLGSVVVPLGLDNKVDAEAYGIEVSANWSVTDPGRSPAGTR